MYITDLRTVIGKIISWKCKISCTNIPFNSLLDGNADMDNDQKITACCRVI